MWNSKRKRKKNDLSGSHLQPSSPSSPPHPTHPNPDTNSSFLQRAQPVAKKSGYYPRRLEAIRMTRCGGKNSSKSEPSWLLPVLTGKSREQSLKPVLWQGPTPLQHPPCNYTLEWLDSEENWRPELRTAAIFSLHHTSVITWEMNSPGSKLLQNSQRKYGSVFQ